MTRSSLISGLPASLARDGWWLDTPDQARPEAPRSGQSLWGGVPRWVGLVALVALADVLFWHREPGLSLAIFALAIFAVAMVQSDLRRAAWRPTLLVILAILPVVEHLQALSVAFLTFGLAASLVWLQRPNTTLAEIASLVPAFLRCVPGRWLRALSLRWKWPTRVTTEPNTKGRVRQAVRDWAFPLAGGLVIAGLLLQANPVLAGLLQLDVDLREMLSRGLFWAAAAIFIGALLVPDLPDPIAWPSLAGLPGNRIGINAGSVLRALGVFNLLIAVQTATDLSILAFGARLPAGLSVAEYAHRGAYPLLATALLAGAFALAARPFLGDHQAIRPLLLVWLSQNMILCAAAMMRLDHYIDAFGLTYLRLYALIWMGLVAVGLGLVAVQVVLERTNRWLVTRCLALGLGVLYASGFANFAQIIAIQNLRLAKPDIAYICDLGPMAHGALAMTPPASLDPLHNTPVECGILTEPRIENWRDWGLRSWRVARYTALPATPAPKNAGHWSRDVEDSDRRR